MKLSDSDLNILVDLLESRAGFRFQTGEDRERLYDLASRCREELRRREVAGDPSRTELGKRMGGTSISTAA